MRRREDLAFARPARQAGAATALDRRRAPEIASPAREPSTSGRGLRDRADARRRLGALDRPERAAADRLQHPGGLRDRRHEQPGVARAVARKPAAAQRPVRGGVPARLRGSRRHLLAGRGRPGPGGGTRPPVPGVAAGHGPEPVRAPGRRDRAHLGDAAPASPGSGKPPEAARLLGGDSHLHPLPVDRERALRGLPAHRAGHGAAQARQSLGRPGGGRAGPEDHHPRQRADRDVPGAQDVTCAC